MTTEGSQQGPQPGDITGQAFSDLQADGPSKDPDFEGAGAAIEAFYREEPEPGVTAADALGGPGAGEVEDEFMRRGVEDRARRLRQSGISRIFERATGGVKLGAKEAFRLTSAIVSRAANTKVFGQNLTSGLDYALHHKKEIVTNTVQYALTHKRELVGGAVVGGVAKQLATRTILAGTGAFLAAAVAGGVWGAASGGVKEYARQRKDIQIDEAGKALIIAGLRNEFRRLRLADKDQIRNAALKGVVFGVIGAVIGAEFAEFAANNPWVQEQMSRIRLPEIKLPEVKLPAAPPPSVPAGLPSAQELGGVIGAELADANEWAQGQIAKIRLPEIKLPEVKLPQFEGTAPADLPPSQALGFPEVSSPVVAPPAEAIVAPVAPAVEPTTTPAPAAAPTAVPTAEATATPTVSPTASPTGTPTPGAAPELAAAIKPPAAPEPPAGPSRILHPTAPTGAPEPSAAPPVAAPALQPALEQQPPSVDQVAPQPEIVPPQPVIPESLSPTIAPNGAEVSGSVVDRTLTYSGKPWVILDNGVKNIGHLFNTVGETGTPQIDEHALAVNLQKATTLWAHGQLDPSAQADLYRVFHLSNGTGSIYNSLLDDDTLTSLKKLGIVPEK